MKITALKETNTLKYAKNELFSYLSALNIPDTERESINIDLIVNENILHVENSFLDDAFKIEIEGGTGSIIGTNERSVLLAVYHFLYRLGFRFLSPLKETELIPDITSINTIILSESHIYPFRHRGICIEGASSVENILDMIEWMPKLGFNCFFSQFRLPHVFMERWYKHEFNPSLKEKDFNIEISKKYTKRIFDEVKLRSLLLHTFGHGWTANASGFPALGWDKRNDKAEENNNFFAMINGKRQLFHNIPANTNLCYSNNQVIEKLADLVLEYSQNNKDVDYVHFWLADEANNVCECENCNKEILSDQYISILNRIDEKLSENNLDTRIVFLLYQELLWPPIKNKLKNPDRFIIMFAPISRTFEKSYPDNIPQKELPEYKKNHITLPETIEQNLNFLFAWQKNFNNDGFIFDYPLGRAHYGDFGYYNISKILFYDIMKLPKLGLNGYISCQELRTFAPNSLPDYIMGYTLSGICKNFEEFSEQYYKDIYGDFHIHAGRYLKELSSFSHPDYFNGKGNRVSDKVNSDFLKLLQVLENFMPVFKEVRASGSFNIYWSLLEYHNNYSKKLVKALINLSSGNVGAAENDFNNFTEYIQKNEMKFQKFLDVYRIIEVSSRYTGFKVL